MNHASKEVTILCIGDSYTIGEGVSFQSSWPIQLRDLLEHRNQLNICLTVVARSGWTTENLHSALQERFPEHASFDLVILLVGVNDQYQNRSPEEYQRSLACLLGRSVSLAHGVSSRTLVLSLPDWSRTPFATTRDRLLISTTIDTYNRVIQAEVSRIGARYLDVTEISRLAASSSDLIAGDGLHPSGLMYALWAETVSNIVLQELG